MKPILEHLPPQKEESFFARAFEFSYFNTPWHYHPEFELVLILKSNGKRLIGNAVSDFNEGDLSFFGPNLPHIYRNPAMYYREQSSLTAKSVVIHFLEKSIGRDLLALPQAKKITNLLERSGQGMDITGNMRKKVISKMNQLLQSNGMSRLIHLLEILNMLANSSEYKLICETTMIGNNTIDVDRLGKVFAYILQNFQKEIRLEEVAQLAYMTRTSFCRYFQERTKRTFSSVLIDVRLNHASKLLLENNLRIIDVAYESGYNNLSNFNRQFKHKFSINPKEYQQVFLANLKNNLHT
jgi:AraC-like DNA-binding protein